MSLKNFNGPLNKATTIRQLGLSAVIAMMLVFPAVNDVRQRRHQYQLPRFCQPNLPIWRNRNFLRRQNQH